MYKLLINAKHPRQVIISPQRIVKDPTATFDPIPSQQKPGDASQLLIWETDGQAFLYKKEGGHEMMGEEIAHDIYPDHLEIKTQALFLKDISKPVYLKLLKHLQQRKEHIQLLQLIIDLSSSSPSIDLVIYFKTTLISEELFTLFLEDLCLFPLYVQEVVLVRKEQHEQLEKELLCLMNDFSFEKGREDDEQMNFLCKQTYTQLPKCLLCLVKLEHGISGLPKRIASHKQLICSQEPCSTCLIVEKQPKGLYCYRCSSPDDMWVCMVCSRVGCGRYKNADAFKHFLSSGHVLTINLETQRIWNYQSDSFCHRLVPLYKQESTLKFPDYLGKKTSKLYEETVESAFWEYCSLVSEELERQRVFYEKQTIKEEERFEKQSTSVEKKLMETEKEIDLKTQEVKKLSKKHKKLAKRLNELRQKCSQDRQLLSSYDTLLAQRSKEEIGLPDIEKDNPKIQEKLKILLGLEEEIEHTLLKLTE